MGKNSTESIGELLITDIAKMEFCVREIYGILARTNIGMSWGINSPATYSEKVLAFKVNGFLHKGWVYISLDWDDTFRITLTKSNRTTIVKEQKGVYMEDLINSIDLLVEKNVSDKEYSEQVNNTFLKI